MRRTILVLAGLGLLLAGAAQPPSQILIMPRELVDYAAGNGCRQVDDFFQRHEMVDPPYAYGYLPGNKEDSAVFWCQTGEGDHRRFWLLIMQKNEQKGLGGCPKKFEWTGRSYPQGLTISQGVAATLDEFHYLSNPHRKGPKGVRVTGNVIVTAYGGTSFYIYCYKGEWLLRYLD